MKCSNSGDVSTPASSNVNITSPTRHGSHAFIAAVLAFALASCSLAISGCSPDVSSSQPSDASTAVEPASEPVDEQGGGSAPESSTGKPPSTPEELQMASNAAEVLSVPYNGAVVCTIGEPFYSEELGCNVRSISFYENGKLCAGVDCTEDGTPVANFVYY